MPRPPQAEVGHPAAPLPESAAHDHPATRPVVQDRQPHVPQSAPAPNQQTPVRARPSRPPQPSSPPCPETATPVRLPDPGYRPRSCGRPVEHHLAMTTP